MTLRQGRVVRNGQPMTELTLAYAHTEPATPEATARVNRGYIVRRERVEVAQQAVALLTDAREQATRILAEAERRADEVRQAARSEGLEQGAAKLASAWLVLNKTEAQADEQALERSVAIGRLLAERLIGESLRLHPDLVAALAREAMHHLWRSKKVTIHANPEDVPALERHAATFGLPPERVTIAPDETRARGSLRFVSDFGELDGELAPQLERLAEVIRQELGTGPTSQ